MLPRYENQINDIRSKLANLISEVVEAHNIALDAYKTKNIQKFDDVKGVLKSIQIEANVIDNEIVKTFALFGPEAQELRLLITYLKMTNELIRIGEGAKKYARRMKAHCESDCNLESISDVIIKLHSSSIAALQFIADCFNNHSECDYSDLYRSVMVEESKCDDLHSILEKEILSRIIIEGELSIEYVKVLSTLRKLERASDHAINIAKLMLYSKEGGEIQSY
ncbi:MAG: PhoU family transcriptional regulator [Arcobacter sp.]|nr:MAG: PhoU family transcriptional regulator [Arcobacter sp.]